MKERGDFQLDENLIKEALAEKLDRAAPRRDLWPSIRAEVERRQSRPRMWRLRSLVGQRSILVGPVLAVRPAGLALSLVAASMLLAWLLLAQPWVPERQVLARHAGEYWYRSGESATVNAALSYDTFFNREGVNPFVDTGHNNFCRFAVDVDTASYTAARLLVMGGLLPDPEAVRVEDFINYFSDQYEPPAEEAFAIQIEGGPSPFGGDNHWLIRVGLKGRIIEPGEGQVIAWNATAHLHFIPEVVSGYRQLGYEYQRVPHGESTTDSMVSGQVVAGQSVTALYELNFRDGAEGHAVTVHVSYVDPDTGDEVDISREFNRADFGLTFEETTPYFQLDATVAEYAEILRRSYWAQGSSLEQVGVMAERVSTLLPGDPDAAEFAGLVARASRLSAEPPS